MEHIETKLQKKKKRLNIKKKHQNETIDFHHTKKMEYFSKLQEKILPKKIKELTQLEKEYIKFQNNPNEISNLYKQYNKELDDILQIHSKKKYNFTIYNKKIVITPQQSNYLDCDITESILKQFPELKNLKQINDKIKYKNELKQNIEKLNQEIESIKQREEEINYFERCNHLLMNYYNNNNNLDEQSVQEYYKLNNLTYYSYTSNNEYNNGNNFCMEDDIITLKNTNIYNTIEYKCKYCNIDMDIEKSSYYVCFKCGYCIEGIGASVSNNYHDQSYKDKNEIQLKPKFYYKRRQYFKERLCQIQGKENIKIPEEIIDHIKTQMKIYNLGNHHLDIPKVKEILKLKQYSKWYEHIPLIIKTITGKYNLNIPENEENILMYMFDVVNEIYEIYKEECKWKNTIPINYYFYKFSQILNKSEYLQYFPLIDKKKMYERDKMWQKIINHIEECGIDNTLIQNSCYMNKIDINWRYLPNL